MSDGLPALPSVPLWATLVRADNPGPMTLEGTNTWVLRARGSRGCVVVDPGPLDERHLRAVAAYGPVEVVLLTHGHPDHAEGAAAFAAIVRAPLRAYDPGLCAAGGEPLRTDGADVVAGGLVLRVLLTPGHTADSVSFLVEGSSAGLLTGDTVLGRGTTVVAHPDGVLGDYLRSLQRLSRLALRGQAAVPLLPGHGPAGADAASVASAYLEHRRQRVDQVRAALADGAGSAAEVVQRVYADVDPALWPAAELSVRATLRYLAEEE